MIKEQYRKTQHRLACVQFIAEVSLIANCKPADLKLAMSIIADLADSGNRGLDQEKNIYYEVK
ncbi:hypothetical protein [Cedecea sp.]|jgi:hypothetical protein|uniref:hypothetical protein n=1 Tax=Cedecea sp. TaxID=1970739 RepID=UPI002F3E8724